MSCNTFFSPFFLNLSVVIVTIRPCSIDLWMSVPCGIANDSISSIFYATPYNFYIEIVCQTTNGFRVKQQMGLYVTEAIVWIGKGRKLEGGVLQQNRQKKITI